MKKSNNTVRIIAGSLRGRRIGFPDHAGLRPSGDRLRETLFSWLHDALPDSHCLDMFAGSGVLGFESISRGAAQAVLLEQSQAVCRVLKENCELLAIDNLHIGCADALRPATLQRYCEPQSIDIVFIDPPFDGRIHQVAIDTLHESGVLAVSATVAVESAKRDNDFVVPAAWHLSREKLAGEVVLQLYSIDE